jgi:hypothetical protein
MPSPLFNVRLDPDRRRKVKALRARGIVLSDVVREAIDRRFAALDPSSHRSDVRALVARIFATHPDPAELPPRSYDVHDRWAARLAIRRKRGKVKP